MVNCRILRVLATVCLMHAVSYCFGDQEGESMERAKMYFEAGDYAQARSIYENLLSSEQEAWKKSILEYNIATVVLEEGNRDEAVKLYSAIPLGKEPFPLLVVSIRTNLAIARWKVARKIVERMASGGTYYEEDYLKAVFLLNQALIDVKKASDAYCDQLAGEGDHLCAPSYRLNELREALQQQLAVVEVEHLRKSLTSMTPKSGVPLILTGLYAIKEELEQYLNVSIPEEIKNEQGKRIFDQASSWEDVWDAIEPQTENNTLFHKAKSEFDIFIASLRKGDFVRSFHAIDSSEAFLNEYMGALYDHNSIAEFIEKLLVGYQKAELQIPLQEAHLRTLNEQQQTIIHILRDKNIDLSMLQKASEHLESAIEYIKKGKYQSARVNLTFAYQLMRRFRWIIRIKDRPLVGDFLEQLVSEEMSSIVINYAFVRMEMGEDVKNSGLDIRSQELTISLASQFWKLAVQEQKEDYHKAIEEGEERGHRCQYQPWVQVVELFDKGYLEAQKAFDILKGTHEKHPGLIHQDAAMRLWREALEKLKNTPPQESCSAHSQAPKQEEKEQKPQPQQQNSINDVLRLLQKMEQDDRKKKGKVGKVRVMEEKAW